MSHFKTNNNENGIRLPLHAQNATSTHKRKKLAVDRSTTQAALDELHEIRTELRAELKIVNRQIFDLSRALNP